jgi:DNA (cytosine-5)-methyltransferase 3A
MNVLSLFDGISAGRVALQRAGVTVDNYYASEVDKYAMQVSSKNFPDIIQLGDITKWREWDIDWGSIDLVIGGSPCQGFSFAGKQLNFEDPRSKLFFEFVDICHRVADENPKMKFLLENVRMKKEFQDVISGYMGIEPVMINSALVSAQNRVRFYWTNIPNVTQPEDNGIVLRDILENSVDDKYYLSQEAIDYMGRLRNGKQRWEYHKNPIDGKAACLTANMYKGVPYGVVKITGAAQRGRYLVDGKRAYHKVDNMVGLTEQRLEFRDDEKCNCLTTVSKDSLVGIRCVQIATLDMKGNDTIRRVYDEDGKSPCITTSTGGHRQPKVFDYDKNFARKLTPVECERLQTFDDGYTDSISNSQRYKALGNSWTVDVIAHIFKGLI